MFTSQYITSQIITVVAYVLFGISYFSKEKNKILIYNTLFLLLISASYFLLNADSGLAMMLLAVARNAYLYLRDNNKFDFKKWFDLCVLSLIYGLIIFLAIKTYTEFLSLFSVFATSLYTFSIWQNNNKIYTYLGIIVSVLWLIYNIHIFTLFGIILESLLLVTIIITAVLKSKPKPLVAEQLIEVNTTTNES